MKAIVSMHCDVEVTINDPEVITRYTGPGGDEMREQFYKLRTEQDVIEHLAYNCLANGCENAKLLDGWADLSGDAVAMRIVQQSVEADS